MGGPWDTLLAEAACCHQSHLTKAGDRSNRRGQSVNCHTDHYCQESQSQCVAFSLFTPHPSLFLWGRSLTPLRGEVRSLKREEWKKSDLQEKPASGTFTLHPLKPEVIAMSAAKWQSSIVHEPWNSSECSWFGRTCPGLIACINRSNDHVFGHFTIYCH